MARLFSILVEAKCLLSANLTQHKSRMKNRFLKFWNYLGNQTKPQFFHKYVLPSLCIFFLWGFIGHQILIHIGEDYLEAKNGTITEIGIKFEQGTRQYHKQYPLKIKLDNNIEYRLQDLNEELFPYILSHISTGDYVTIYTRKKWLSILSWGKKNDLYKIVKNNKEILSFSSLIKSIRTQSNIPGVFFFVLIPWYIIYRIKKT
ncbi:hypothetical protein [Sphingobacterium rhinopitheci]|uniref:hypothetical protein n=1 Tax=Sphingobacterium rhinopitheci TaxID=2781960 RepID=UPI001F5293A9|nr:hypothetical protein [Sphingobacterium rhinopitheci]MCI0921225.1 hypothetical protein [Sphingobacterium rhinopitheci]